MHCGLEHPDDGASRTSQTVSSENLVSQWTAPHHTPTSLTFTTQAANNELAILSAGQVTTTIAASHSDPRALPDSRAARHPSNESGPSRLYAVRVPGEPTNACPTATTAADVYWWSNWCPSFTAPGGLSRLCRAPRIPELRRAGRVPND